MTLTLVGASLLIVVKGDPVSQGSKSAFAVRRKDGKGGWVYTGAVAVSEGKDRGVRLKSWRTAVVEAAQDARGETPTLTGAVGLRATFTLARPKGHFGTGRNAGVLRPSAPKFPAVKPDDGKLYRAVGDALKTAGVYRDDALVCDAHLAKRYPVLPWAGDGTAGLESLPDPTVLCGVADADVLAVPGVVVRVWELDGRPAQSPVVQGPDAAEAAVDASMSTGVLW